MTILQPRRALLLLLFASTPLATGNDEEVDPQENEEEEGCGPEVTAKLSEPDMTLRVSSGREEQFDTNIRNSNDDRNAYMASLKNLADGFKNTLEKGGQPPSPTDFSVPISSAMAATAGPSAYAFGRALNHVGKEQDGDDYKWAIIQTTDDNGEPLSASAEGSIEVKMQMDGAPHESLGMLYLAAQGHSELIQSGKVNQFLLTMLQSLRDLLNTFKSIPKKLVTPLQRLLDTAGVFIRTEASFRGTGKLGGSTGSVNTSTRLVHEITEDSAPGPANEIVPGVPDHLSLMQEGANPIEAEIAVEVNSKAYGYGLNADGISTIFNLWCIVLMMSCIDDDEVVNTHIHVAMGKMQIAGDLLSSDESKAIVNRYGQFQTELMKGLEAADKASKAQDGDPKAELKKMHTQLAGILQ